MTTTPHGQVPAIQRYKIGYGLLSETIDGKAACLAASQGESDESIR